MREIKFRGKVKDGTWRYGFIMNWAGHSQIWENTLQAHNCIVDEKTVGQFTGLKDCNGTEIFEGDTLINVDVTLEEGVKLQDTQQQVFWCEKEGAWKLDNTFKQNKKDGWMLAKELKDFRFKVFGNIYKTKSVGEKVL